VPGIGPIISSAMVAAIGNGAAFCKGRDFAAWLGLVPKQMSTGDRTILGRITKLGNRYLRMLFIQGARAVLLRPASWVKHSFGSWLTAATRRLHRNVLAVALANKLACRGLRVGLRRWRNGLTVASVILMYLRPSRALSRMRSDARGYP
jgi:transposase